jgi:hypothetical protein
MSARVAIYARVSTVNHGQDASLQTREMRQFATSTLTAVISRSLKIRNRGRGARSHAAEQSRNGRLHAEAGQLWQVLRPPQAGHSPKDRVQRTDDFDEGSKDGQVRQLGKPAAAGEGGLNMKTPSMSFLCARALRLLMKLAYTSRHA